MLPYAHYIAGISLLRTTPVPLKKGELAVRFSELQQVTGLSSEKTIFFLESMRTDPEKGKMIYDIMRSAFTAQTDSINK